VQLVLQVLQAHKDLPAHKDLQDLLEHKAILVQLAQLVPQAHKDQLVQLVQQEPLEQLEQLMLFQ
jgi:hypothetical protein